MTRSISLTVGEDPLPHLLNQLDGLNAPAYRPVVALAGGPGAGKSTLAAALVGELNKTRPGQAVHVPMDGFHMKQEKLERLNLAHRKGAPETFESAAFVAFLSELKHTSGPTTGPGYSRKIEDVVENAYVIGAQVRILVVEGNYLLLATSPWNQLAALIDLAVFLDVPRGVVRRRLLRRHGAEGRFSQEQIVSHVRDVDLPNFALVHASRSRADLILSLS